MENVKRNIQDVFNWFGFKKTSKLFNIPIYQLRKMNLENNRVKDTLKIRRKRIINPNLEPSHMADFGKLAYNSLFDANKHVRTVKNQDGKSITIGIIKNLKTKKVIWILTHKNENSSVMESLILSAQLRQETISVLRVDNQAYIKVCKKHNVTIQIIPKSTTKPYNTEIEQQIGLIQKTIQRNWNKIKRMSKQFSIESILTALCYCAYEDNPLFLLRLIKQFKQIESKQLIKPIRQ